MGFCFCFARYTESSDCVAGSVVFGPGDSRSKRDHRGGFRRATLAASSRGAYSAEMLLDGGAYPFSGSFASDGSSQKILNRPGKPPVTVNLQLDLTTTNDQLIGQISGSDGVTNWLSSLQAYRTPFHNHTNAARYTLIIPPGENTQTNQPGGYGYATLSQTAAGRLAIHGKLGDGAAASQSVLIPTNGQVPLYFPLYSGQGSLQGWLTLTNLAGTNLTWIKLSGRPHTLYSGGLPTPTSPSSERRIKYPARAKTPWP